MSDAETLADIVVLNIKAAVAPLVARLSAIEAGLGAVNDLRERLVVVETKSAIPSDGLQALRDRVDAIKPVALDPVLERLAASEARIDAMGDVRDRLVTVETKSAIPTPVDDTLCRRVDAVHAEFSAALGLVNERLSAFQGQVSTLGEVRDRLVTVETKSAGPAPVDAGLTQRVEAISTEAVAAIGQVNERLAAVEARLSTLGDLRDRVVVAETKAMQSVPVERPSLDAEALVRIVAAETKAAAVESTVAEVKGRLAVIDDLKDRIVAVEAHKASTPPSDLGPDMRDRVVALETKMAGQSASDLVKAAVEDVAGEVMAVRDRVVALETKASEPPNLGDVRDRLMALETKATLPTAAELAAADINASVAAIEERVAGVQPEIVALRERTAVLESKSLIQGPAGKDGADGRDGANGRDGIDGKDAASPEEVKDLRDRVARLEPLSERLAVVEVKGMMPGPKGEDGQPGKDGKDGLGWDDLEVAQDSDRSFVVKCVKGERVKTVGVLTLPVDIYRGVYRAGQPYERGDGVTWAGSEWHCNEPTTSQPGDGSKAWTLKVKRGRDGKDGKDGEPGRPGRDSGTK